jgi:hypothetical protein
LPHGLKVAFFYHLGIAEVTLTITALTLLDTHKLLYTSEGDVEQMGW